MVKRKQQWRKAYEVAEKQRQEQEEAAEAARSIFFEDRGGEEPRPSRTAGRRRRSARIQKKVSSSTIAPAAPGAEEGQELEEGETVQVEGQRSKNHRSSSRVAAAEKRKQKRKHLKQHAQTQPLPEDTKPTASTTRSQNKKKASRAADAAWSEVATGKNETLRADPWATAQPKLTNTQGYLVSTSTKPQPPVNLKALRKKRLWSERRVADRDLPLEPAHPGSSFHPEEGARLKLIEIASNRLAEEKHRRDLVDAGLRHGPSNLYKTLENSRQQGNSGPAATADSPDEEEDSETEEGPARKKGKVSPIEVGAKEAEDDGTLHRPQAEYKSRRQRKKEAAHRKRLMEAALRRREKKKDVQLGRVDIIAKEIQKEDRLQEKALEERKEMLEARPELRPNLSRNSYVEPFPEVLLDDEVGEGSLLQVEPSAHTVRHQFKRFEQRALVEPLSATTLSAEFSGDRYFRDKKRRKRVNVRYINRKFA